MNDTCAQNASPDRLVCSGLTRAERGWFEDQRVLVTGAGGAMGSALVRAVSACGPATLTLVEQSESQLFHLERELAVRWPDLRVHPVLGDITRQRVMRAACEAANPHVVFHAAAYTNVAMLERDVCAGVLANVLGTVSAVDAARDAGARFVLLSSDTAVNPRSVLGATRRLAELITLSRIDVTFRPLVVRFGDVLGSHAEDTTARVLTAADAATLVLRADSMRQDGDVCWLDGQRPPDTLDDDLVMPGLDLLRTDDDRIWIVRHAAVDGPAVRRVVRSLRADLSLGDGLSALSDLCAAVPEYEAGDGARRAAGMVTLNADLVFLGIPHQLVA